MRRRVLILGGSSFVGRHLMARLGPERALTTYCRTPVDAGVYFDALTMRLSDIITTPEDFSHAVILLADTDPDSCAADHARSWRLNVESIITILADLSRWEITPVFASSEFVFDGTQGDYTEEDEPHPILTYGEQKLAVEHELQRQGGQFLIVRFSKIFGLSPGDGTLFTNWLEAIERGQTTIRCAADQVFSPIAVQDVVQAILRLIERECTGLFHVSGPAAYSRLDLLKLLVARLQPAGRGQVTIVPCSIHDFELREKRPLNVSMKPNRLVAATQIRLRGVEEVCHQLVGGMAVCQ
ncbi:MAG: sugar nucleotide-binding protein [Candidatus Omnitrophica bacterium]|nr:sugar nucleotide-binding protein [Candidatus Omnitrophota bacterium]